MQRKLFLILALALMMAVAASGQTKTAGTLSCGNPDKAYSIEVGDRTGHTLAISKFPCTWRTPMEIAGLQTKEGYDVSYGDARGATVRASGYHTTTMSNGDKIYVRFQGTDTTKDGKPDTTEGTWSYTGGTGKLKGIKGKGTYKGQADSSGNMVAEIEGDYELPAAK
jgi:hypothetical protein